MYQVKVLKANQVEQLEDSINNWLKDQQDLDVVDLKFHSNAFQNGMVEYLAVLIHQV